MNLPLHESAEGADPLGSTLDHTAARPQEPNRGIDAVLADARSRYARVLPAAAYAEVTSWSPATSASARPLLVDIRPQAQRQLHGEVAPELAPLVIERNVLEWRLDPRSQARLPQADENLRVLVLCQEGYASSLAAESLLRLGLTRATDVVGGFRAWQRAGLPVGPATGPWTY